MAIYNGGLNIKNIDLLNTIYPIGSIFLTVSNTPGPNSPAQWLGGTWERISQGYALWTASSDAGKTIDPGLPNITGYVTTQWRDSSAAGIIFDRDESGCLSTYINGNSAYALGDRTGSNFRNTIKFNANSGAVASGIYKDNCTTVQPPAYKVYA